jgi:serine/threonine protein kinase
VYNTIFPDGTTTTVVPTTTPGWLLKIATGREEPFELASVLLLYANPPRNCCRFPDRLDALLGTAPGLCWLAMQQYSGSAISERAFCRTNWLLLARDVLAFLEDLHVGIRHIHGDIKAGNILVNVARRQFVVADFGLLDLPGGALVGDLEADRKWYALAWGGEPEQPVRGWRQDLVALGYLLAELTWPGEMSRTFYADCLAQRASSVETESMVMQEILWRRDAEISHACGVTLRTYFEMLESSGPTWDALRPPPRVFYRALAALFV